MNMMMNRLICFSYIVNTYLKTLQVCRQIYYELAETYSAMMDNKLALLEGDVSRPSSQQTKKINTLATSSIQHFLHYLDSLKDET